jgi:hypothetical protein
MNKSKLIVGQPGAGKTQLLASLLENANLRNKMIICCGGLRPDDLNFSKLSEHESCLFINPPNNLNNDTNAGDLLTYVMKRQMYKEFEHLIILDETANLSVALINQIFADFGEDKITLWMATQQLSFFFDFDKLNKFQNYYFFRSASNEYFFNQQTISLLEQLPLNDSNSYIHFSTSSEVKPFYIENLKERMAEVNGKIFDKRRKI